MNLIMRFQNVTRTAYEVRATEHRVGAPSTVIFGKDVVEKYGDN